jgi:TatD DNase family protein
MDRPARPRFYDAHNHLQDERLAGIREPAIADLRHEGVHRMVVNGSCEQDWPAVLDLARALPEVIPSFGYHPWYIKERSGDWAQRLTSFLDQVPAGIGEIGLDCWIKDYDLEDQRLVLALQLRLAAERDLPVSIHCLQAWGPLLELLEQGPRPACGFVLHSFGGPREMIDQFARLGAYFSLPGYFAHERKNRQREVFLHVPRSRLLIETDAPDQLLPPERVRYPLLDGKSGKPLNHPANLPAVYAFASELLGECVESLAAQVEINFRQLFGKLERACGRPGSSS